MRSIASDTCWGQPFAARRASSAAHEGEEEGARRRRCPQVTASSRDDIAWCQRPEVPLRPKPRTHTRLLTPPLMTLIPRQPNRSPIERPQRETPKQAAAMDKAVHSHNRCPGVAEAVGLSRSSEYRRKAEYLSEGKRTLSTDGWGGRRGGFSTLRRRPSSSRTSRTPRVKGSWSRPPRCSPSLSGGVGSLPTPRRCTGSLRATAGGR